MATESLKKRIGKSIQKARKQAGYKSAKEYAAHMDMKVGTYSDYEQGRRVCMLDRAWEFADDLGLTLDELVGRDFPRPAFADPRQEQLNGCYESLNDESKTQVSDMVKSIAADPARRIEKDGQGSEDSPGVEVA